MAPIRLRAAATLWVLFLLLFPGLQRCTDAAGIEDAKTGIVGTSANDSIHSGQPVDVNSVLETTSDEDVTTAATGIDGFAGDDQITVGANVTTNASSKIEAPYVPLKVAGTTSDSSSKGVRGGDGADLLLNLASLLSTSTSYAEIAEVVMQINLGATLFPTEAIADAVGIEGGTAPDYVENNNAVNATASAETLIKQAQISAVEVPADVYGFGDARTTATSTAVGIAGDTLAGTSSAWASVRETISNHGPLSAVSTATATTEQGMVELLGAARVDDSTIADAFSAGILGGVHDNLVINYQTIDSDAVSSANMTSVELKMMGLMLKPTFDLFGFDVGTFQTVAASTAVGIAGNTGNDVIINAGTGGTGWIDVYGEATADSDVLTFSVSPPLGGGKKATGALAAGSLALPVLAAAPASNDGSTSAYGDASTVAVSDTGGILGGAGNDDIMNDVSLTSQAESEASNLTLSVDIGLDKTSFIPLPGAAVADASTTAVATSRGIDGGTGSDTITNNSAVNAYATADADSLGIAATIKGSVEGLAAGAAVTDSSSTSVAAAKGITGGTGGDTVTNTGVVTSMATSLDESTSISVTIAGEKIGIAAGVTLADAVTEAVAYSLGIDGEDAGADESASVVSQNDLITNEGQIWSTANSAAHGDAVGVSFAAALDGISVSVALAETDVNSTAYATGIRSGIGEDIIENKGFSSAGVHATSIATSSSDSVSVAVSGDWIGVAMGASYAEANTDATAGAVGVDAGDSNDVITNNAQVVVSSTAGVSSNAISVTAAVAPKGFSAGVAFSETETNSAVEATGIDGGRGDDVIENVSVVSATSAATTKTKSVSVNFAEAGAAIADVSSEAKAESTGLESGEGVDELTNSGTVLATATSVSDDTGAAANLAGYARGDIASTSMATATGLSGGETSAGQTIGDALTNTSGARIEATATANAYADNYVVQGGGVQFAKVGSTADAHATAMAGGVLGDTIENDGTVISTAISDLHANSFNFQLFGVQAGSVGVNAVGTARGIDASAGENTVMNSAEGTIDTYADLKTTSLNTEASIGAQLTRAGVTADAVSQGILSGADRDIIDNDGSITATAKSLGQAGGASIGLISASLVNALASADIDGISAGGGNDVVTNDGIITAGAIKTGDSFLVKAETAAVSFDFASLIFSSLGAEASIAGIQGGAGNDTIFNNGIIYIGNEAPDDGCTDQRSMVIGDSFSYGGQWLGTTFAFSGSSARNTSIGIDGGADNDALVNSGTVTVKARSYGDVGAEVSLGIGLLDSLAKAEVQSTAKATGIFGGTGEDTITNYSTIAADALTIADAQTEATIDLATEPEATSEATAVARAAGMDGGSLGKKTHDNYGNIDASANAGAWTRMYSETEDKRAHASGYGLAQSEAYGITSESPNNTATNHDTGNIVVFAKAGTYDTLGNTGYAFAEEDANIDAGQYHEGTNQWTPLSAEAAGILFSDGDDVVMNDGTVTVTSSVIGTIYANSNSWVRYPFSTARAVVLSQAKGISAGKGSNELTNNGDMTIQALSHAAPKVYSWSRDYQATANTYGQSTAKATGMEADGILLNSADGILDVTARATSWANAPTNSEFATATALVNATASGFATFTDTGLTGLQHITNEGTATVRALAGEDAAGNSEQIAWVNTNITTRDSTANCSGTSTVDAAGVRVGDGVKEITNNGALTVLGRARADLTTAGGAHTYARSYYYNPEANSYAKGNATATGILAAAGENHVYNFGTMDVTAETQDVYAWSDSYSSWSTCYSKAETFAETTGQGIRVGTGDDEIRNTGSLTVTSSANAHSYAYADTRDNNLADEYETSRAASDAIAIGIDGGMGTNTIENEGTLNVSATALAQVYAGGGHASVTATTNSTASATGITVGDGGSFIRNSGTVSVQARAYYVNGAATLAVSTVGIQGGSGDDTIVNAGHIDTSTNSGVWDAIATLGTGIGIDAGEGNDTVVLADGSSISGDAVLGDGDDTLALIGSPMVNGLILAGDGADALLLDGAGHFGHNLWGFNHVTKQGAGTYAVTGLDSPTTLEIKQGTLEIDNDFEFAATSSFSTVTNPDGSCGQLNIGGAGGLDGTLAVEREDGLFREQVSYDIITANTLSGTFSEVLLPEPAPLLEFSMEQTSDRVRISATPRSYASVASNEVARNVGEYLDRIAPQATGELPNTLSIFQTLPADDFSAAFASLSPTFYDSATKTTFDVTSQYSQTLLKRMHSLRSHIERTDAGPACSQTERYATWIDAFSHWANQDSRSGFVGYDYDLTGAAVGVDRLLGDGFLAGVSYGQSKADMDMDHDSGRGDIDSYFGSLYGSYFTDRMYFDTTLSYGRQCYENIRAVEVGPLAGAAHSDHHGDVYSAYVETGWNLSLTKWILQPFAGLRYTFLDEESYEESGVEGVNLRVEERKTDALTLDLGLRFAYPFEKDTWLCIPEATVAWDHDFDLDDHRITAAFDGSPTMTFVTDGRDIDKDGIVLGAGLTLIRRNNLSLSVKYTGEFRSHYEVHALAGGIRYEF